MGSSHVTIVGGGLAGAEAAWQLACRDVDVTLVEMKPNEFSPAHQDPGLAELVCSNSFGATGLETAAGLLQWEAATLGSLVVREARRAAVPAGRALAVDRSLFSRAVTRLLEDHPRIAIVRERVDAVPADRPVLICTGPLTAGGLARDIQARVGEQSLYFYDAIAPIILGDSIDRAVVFQASRYDNGTGDYLNCPLDRETYEAFVEALLEADRVSPRPFEEEKLFQACQPIEALASRGRDTLAFGPMRPVGLVDPRTGERPHAVVQLRREDREGTLWNLVGFQTRLTHGAQKRVFRMIPGLHDAVFVRLGSVHRNTFLNAPRVLTERLALKQDPGIYVGGQLTGVEGYLESTVTGLMAALFIHADLTGRPLPRPPADTMTGALLRYLQEADPKTFQPMNATFGLLPSPGRTPRKRRRQIKATRARGRFLEWAAHLEAQGGTP